MCIVRACNVLHGLKVHHYAAYLLRFQHIGIPAVLAKVAFLTGNPARPENDMRSTTHSGSEARTCGWRSVDSEESGCQNLRTPACFFNVETLKNNCRVIGEKCKRLGVQLRSHTTTERTT